MIDAVEGVQYKEPKFPRVLVSLKRHKSLSIQAKKMGMSVAQLAEEKFSAFDGGTKKK